MVTVSTKRHHIVGTIVRLFCIRDYVMVFQEGMSAIATPEARFLSKLAPDTLRD
jgi:hypothetical protein